MHYPQSLNCSCLSNACMESEDKLGFRWIHEDSSWPWKDTAVLWQGCSWDLPPSQPLHLQSLHDKEETKIIFRYSLSYGKFCKLGLLRFSWIFPAICLNSMCAFATPKFHFEFQVQTGMLKAQIETHLKSSDFTYKTVSGLQHFNGAN